MRGLFVTGTDTGVGKTVVAAALALRLGAGVAKPVQSGADGDAERLKALVGVEDPLEEICPYAFEAALAPAVAARLEGRELVLREVADAVQALSARHETLVVEGVGGLLAPMGSDWVVADLAVALDLPLVAVARATLGTVNHTLLTVEAAERRGLHVAGVVLNGVSDESTATNGELISAFGRVPVIGHTPWMEQVTREALLGLELDVEALFAHA